MDGIGIKIVHWLCKIVEVEYEDVMVNLKSVIE